MDGTVALIADRQRGLITRAQASSIGLDSDRIQYRLDSGRWTQVHENVYRVGGAPDSVELRRLAAVLAVGPVAAVSHRAAAEMHGLWTLASPVVEITTTRDQSPELDVVVVHRLADLHPRWITVVDGVPCTTVARTLVDLGAVMSEPVVAECLDRARGRGLVTVSAVETARAGCGAAGEARCRSDPSRPRASPCVRTGRGRVRGADGAGLLAEQELPAAVPEYEVWTEFGAFVARVDFAYPELRLAIEVDGFAAHSSVDAFRRDRTRQNALVAAGWTVLRFTWTEVNDNSPSVGRMIRVCSPPPRRLSPLFLARKTGNSAVLRAKNEDEERRGSGAVLHEAVGVGEHDRHEVLGGADAEAAAQAPALAVVGHVVAAAVRAPQQRGNRVPRMRGELGRRRVVAGHCDDVGSERPHLGDDRVERLDLRDLAGPVAVLAGRVGVLVVQEEVVVVGPGIAA